MNPMVLFLGLAQFTSREDKHQRKDFEIMTANAMSIKNSMALFAAMVLIPIWVSIKEKIVLQSISVNSP